MAERMLLPYYGSQEDLLKILEYLRSKPLGAQEADIKMALGGKLLDGRKADFYDLFGLFTRSGAGYRLTEDGMKFIAGDQHARQEMVRARIRSFKPYLALIEWAYHNGVESLDAQRARHYWVQSFANEVDVKNKWRLDAAPLTFFGICDMAGFGNFVIGRRGQPSRLELERGVVSDFLRGAGEGTLASAQEPSPISVAGSGESEQAPHTLLPSPEEVVCNPPVQGRHVISFPIMGKMAQLVWAEATLSVAEWRRFKKIGDAMFDIEEEEEKKSDAT